MVAFFVPPVFGKQAAATIAQVGVATSTSSSSTVTFTGASLGAEDPTRRIIVSIFSGGTARTLTTFTVGGIAVTRIIETSYFCLGIVDIPTGTTANIVTTWSGTKSSWGLAVYRTTGLRSATPVAGGTVSFSGLTASTAYTIPAGGVVVGYMHGGGSSSRTATWVGVTEGFDAYIRTVASNGYAEMHSGGSAAYAEGQAAQTVSVTLSGDLADDKSAYFYVFR